jgi:hypothetical protein
MKGEKLEKIKCDKKRKFTDYIIKTTSCYFSQQRFLYFPQKGETIIVVGIISEKFFFCDSLNFLKVFLLNLSFWDLFFRNDSLVNIKFRFPMEEQTISNRSNIAYITVYIKNLWKPNIIMLNEIWCNLFSFAVFQ